MPKQTPKTIQPYNKDLLFKEFGDCDFADVVRKQHQSVYLPNYFNQRKCIFVFSFNMIEKYFEFCI